MMELHVEGICDIGLVRKTNQDKLFMDGEIFTNGQKEIVVKTDQTRAFVVADGMGGHKAGDVASAVVLESFSLFAGQRKKLSDFESFRQDIFQWTENITRQLETMGNKNPNLGGMGTTLTGIIFDPEYAFIFNAGDSRIYQYRKGQLKQLTTDHSLANATGNKYAPSNLLVNSIGGGLESYVDVENVSGLFQKGDLLIICSDGLTDMLNDEQIKYLCEPLNTRKMVDQAKEQGGRDNISLITIYF
jgi:protein phosphatase